MSIALNRTGSGGDHQIERPGFSHCGIICAPSSIYNSMVQHLVPEDQIASLSSSSSTSSIGKNSDEFTGGGGDVDEEEAQSEYKGGPLDSLEALEEVLPIKKSISMFYNGKSKSFTNVSDAASCSSIEDIAKPENEYTRKRKNLLALNNFLDKNHNVLRSAYGGVSKRHTNSKSMFSVAATMNGSESNSGEFSNSKPSLPSCGLPPLPLRARRALHCEHSVLPPAEKFSSLRSFSLFDLHGAAAAEVSSSCVSGSTKK